MPPRHWGHARAPSTFRHCVHRSSDFGYFAFFPARPFQLWATQGVTPNLMRGIYMWRGWGRQTFSHMNALNFAPSPKFCSYPNILPRLRYIPHICHEPHEHIRVNFLVSVNFYRYNAKNWQFTVYFVVIYAFFRCKFYSPKILLV